MRTFWLTARIALIFTALLAISLAATLHLFGRVVGRDVLGELVAVRAGAGDRVVDGIEALLEDNELRSREVRRFVHRHARELDTHLVLLDVDGERVVASCAGTPCGRGRRFARERAARHDADGRARGGGGRFAGRGREWEVVDPASLELSVPVVVDGVQVATLGMARPGDDGAPGRRAFRWGLLRIGLLGLAGVILVSLALTRPLRRMSRSMDRVAAGDLDHRVVVRGRDEVARMGGSFNAMADRIQGMIRGQKELMAGVSHELRSPLSRMKLSLALLRDGGGDTSRIDDLEGEVDALDGMVEELLVASRLELGSSSLTFADAPVEALVDDAWRRIADEAGTRGIEPRVVIGDGAEQVHADRALVVRVLGNLLENAARHGVAGEGPATIEIGAERRDDRVRLSVADRGRGVPADELERLFEPFYRADRSRSRRTGGTGLGMMIVRRAVEAHGGRVDAALRDGGGLRVTFDLPAAGAPGGGRDDGDDDALRGAS